MHPRCCAGQIHYNCRQWIARSRLGSPLVGVRDLCFSECLEGPMSNKIANATTKLVALLEPLDSDERRKSIDAALVILGDTPRGDSPRTSDYDHRNPRGGDRDGWPTHSKLRTWMKQNSISSDQLAELFHLEGGKATVIASSVSGAKGGEKTRNAYLLQGLAGLIETGEPAFADDAARELCRTLGCYDKNNHSNYMRAIGNRVTGSKSAGWKLTIPGLVAAAVIVKATAGGNE
jgi:hypothetical protein